MVENTKGVGGSYRLLIYFTVATLHFYRQQIKPAPTVDKFKELNHDILLQVCAEANHYFGVTLTERQVTLGVQAFLQPPADMEDDTARAIRDRSAPAVTSNITAADARRFMTYQTEEAVTLAVAEITATHPDAIGTVTIDADGDVYWTVRGKLHELTDQQLCGVALYMGWESWEEPKQEPVRR